MPYHSVKLNEIIGTSTAFSAVDIFMNSYILGCKINIFDKNILINVIYFYWIHQDQQQKGKTLIIHKAIMYDEKYLNIWCWHFCNANKNLFNVSKDASFCIHGSVRHQNPDDLRLIYGFYHLQEQAH